MHTDVTFLLYLSVDYMQWSKPCVKGFLIPYSVMHNTYQHPHLYNFLILDMCFIFQGKPDL